MEKSKAAGSTSLLSKKVNIVGDIEGNEDLHVEGRFKGSIKITGNIFVGPTGVVNANVEAENAGGRLWGLGLHDGGGCRLNGQGLCEVDSSRPRTRRHARVGRHSRL